MTGRLAPFVGTLSLAAWLGAALLFASVVAPAAFAVLPARALAGALVGRVLPVLFVVGIGVALLALALDRGVPGLLTLRRAALGVVVASCAIAQFGLGPRIERVRADIGPSLEALAPGDARRASFGRLHAISVALLGAAMLSAAAAIGMTVLAFPGGRDG
jgi:hypothetical protein